MGREAGSGRLELVAVAVAMAMIVPKTLLNERLCKAAVIGGEIVLIYAQA